MKTELTIPTKSEPQPKPKRARSGQGKRQGSWVLHLMILPAVIAVFIFSYLPMGGIIIAFQDFKPAQGLWHSAFVGLKHFSFMFSYDNFLQVLNNTLFFAISKMILHLIVPFIFAILLNEIRKQGFKRSVQTLVYLPHFLSWVILAGILLDVFAFQGIVNRFLNLTGLDSIHFLADGDWFRAVAIGTDVWKDFGFNAIIFLAALASINPSLYEAAEVDGANRWMQTVYVTIPSLIPITIVVATLSLGGILNANFDQIFNMYNPLVYEKADIIDTFVYRMGLLSGQFSFGTAVGLFKSIIGLVLIVISYRLAYKFAGYRIF